MQTSLTEENWEEDTRKEKIQDMLERDVQTLWTMESMTVDKALEELKNRSREFSDFAETFVGDVPKVRQVSTFLALNLLTRRYLVTCYNSRSSN